MTTLLTDPTVRMVSAVMAKPRENYDTQVYYASWVCDQDAYACSGQKCSAQSLLFVHENWKNSSLMSHLNHLAGRRTLDNLTIGPVLKLTSENIIYKYFLNNKRLAYVMHTHHALRIDFWDQNGSERITHFETKHVTLLLTKAFTALCYKMGTPEPIHALMGQLLDVRSDPSGSVLLEACEIKAWLITTALLN
ncbi:putative L-glutamate gamma-semialdehyde dehydrogenase [Helianthus anomalus]